MLGGYRALGPQLEVQKPLCPPCGERRHPQHWEYSLFGSQMFTFCLPSCRPSLGELRVRLVWEVSQCGEVWDARIGGCSGRVSAKCWPS